MAERILTLFGEEIVPEVKPATKGRVKKKPDEEQQEVKKPYENKGVDNKPHTKKTSARQKQTKNTASPETEAVQETKAEKTEEPVAGDEKYTLPEDWEGDKQYYSIGEVAKLFRVKTSQIRFWTNEFKLKVRTTRKGDRLFTEAQIKELRTIHHLVKERKFTLTGAKAKLKKQNKRDVEVIDLKQSLQQLRSTLLTIRNKLSRAEGGDREANKSIER
jgi:DNA-binding transcriptional MerR regulator